MTFSLTDVRVRSTLADYTGNLGSTVTVRITDKQRHRDRCGHGAGLDSRSRFRVPPRRARGATCQITTSFDAVMPGVVKEGRRSIWEFDACG